MPKISQFFRIHFRHQELVFVSILFAAGLVAFPLQHYMSLSRFQHYSLGVYVVALGFIIQLIWSWRHLTIWGRATFGATALYMGAFALTFYSNPWLDPKVALETEFQSGQRLLYAGAFVLCGVPISIFWLGWGIEEWKRTRREAHCDEVKA